MLAKNEKLNLSDSSNLDFFIKAKKKYGHSFIVFYILDSNTSQISVIVSKKYSKKAVGRNLVRRKYYSFLNKNKYLFKNKKIAILHKKASKDFCEIESELERILKNL